MIFKLKEIYQEIDMGFLSYGDGCYVAEKKDTKEDSYEDIERHQLFGWLDDEQ